MKIEIRIPSPGESISEVELARWLVQDGSWVHKDQEVAEVESEKATLPLVASADGLIGILVAEGATIGVNQVACTIDTDAVKPKEAKTSKAHTQPAEQVKPKAVEPIPSPLEQVAVQESAAKLTPLAREIMQEHNLSVDDIVNGLRKITAHDVRAVVAGVPGKGQPSADSVARRTEERSPMSQLRKKLSQRLVAVKNETAMLTTFNEVDMSAVMRLRRDHQEVFRAKHGVKLGFMSFFAKAASIALKRYPMVNSRIDGDEIVSPEFVDLGIAVQTPKGLMVPVLRNAEELSFAQLEQRITEIADKARSGRIGLSDLEGGTFTITNGGIFGSLLSTPIINPPQSGIIGMHNIVDRPVAINGRVEIRPMMYVALSYDHRIIDGRDSVGFLLAIKEMIEHPERMLLLGDNPEKTLLGL